MHISGGKGKIKGTGWIKNINGKWVLTTTGGACKPEKLFYVDKKFTKIKDSKNLVFNFLPEEKKYRTGKHIVTKANLLHVRTGPGINYKKKKFDQLTPNAREQILYLCGGKKADGYVLGTVFNVYDIKDNWGQSPSGWVCLDYCEVM